jgi:hypothetical protein
VLYSFAALYATVSTTGLVTLLQNDREAGATPAKDNCRKKTQAAQKKPAERVENHKARKDSTGIFPRPFFAPSAPFCGKRFGASPFGRAYIGL